MRRFALTLLTSAALLSLPGVGLAQFQPGNIVVSVDQKVKEFTLDGGLVQELAVPSVGETTRRDLVVDDEGELHVYNGTFEPSLSTWDWESNSWTHKSFDDWSTVNNGSYGGIATVGNKVFLTDMETAGASAQGIVVYDLEKDEFSRFGTTIEPIDLNLGLDGFVYALYPGGSPGGNYINVYNPNDECFVRRINLAAYNDNGNRAVAVDQHSNVYVADWYGEVFKFDVQGNLLAQATLATGTQRTFNDIDVDGYGNVVLTNRNGWVLVSNTNLESPFVFRAGATNAFLGFVSRVPPVPPQSTYFEGTDSDDLVVIDPELELIAINGDVCSFTPGNRPLKFYGGRGDDHVICLGRAGEADLAIFRDHSLTLNCSTCSIQVFESERLEFIGNDESDVALFFDSPGVDQLQSSLSQTMLQTYSTTSVATDVASAYVFSFEGEDQAIHDSAGRPESLRCDLEQQRVRIFDQSHLVVIDGFNRFSAFARRNDTDDAIIQDSSASDYLYTRSDYTRIFNSNFDYRFVQYEKLFVWSNGEGMDRATFQKTDGSSFVAKYPWWRQTGPGFDTTVFWFDRYRLNE